MESNWKRPVGDFKTTHLKNMRKSKWVGIFPNFRGENRQIFETTT